MNRPWLILLLLAAATVFCVFGFLEHRQKRSAWGHAQDQQREFDALIAQVKRLDSLPRFAVLQADTPQAIAERITAMASDTVPNALGGIQSESSYRIGNTAYRVIPTRVQLERVTLKEVARFAHALEAPELGLVVSELQITDASGSPERWTVDLKLTQTVYSATVPRGK